MKQQYRSIFISDTHLGTKMANAEYLLDFLESIEYEKLYLVGDIVDVWALKKTGHWPNPHNSVVQHLLNKMLEGQQIIFLPGNHDEFLRNLGTYKFNNLTVIDHIIHQGIDGKNYLVIHGDQFDLVTRNYKWLSKIGAWSYDLLIAANVLVTGIRKILRLPPWSIRAWADQKAIDMMGDFEKNLVRYARKKKMDGVICGHIHQAVIKEVNKITYMNTGDWTGGNSAIAENLDGSWQLIQYDN